MSAPKVYVSPLGRLAFPHLNEPRQFKGQGAWHYDTDLDVEGSAAMEFEHFLTTYAADYAKRVGKRSISLEALIRAATIKDKQTGQIQALEGVTRFHFKVNNLENWDRKPAFFHADGTPYTAEPQIGAGSLVEIAYTIYEWKAGPNQGMTLVPEGIRIHEMKERSSMAVSRDYENLFAGRAATAAASPTTTRSFPKSAAAPRGGGGADF